MPTENVTVSCEKNGDGSDPDAAEELLKVIADFNGQADGTNAEDIATAESGWSFVYEKDRTAVVQNEMLYMAGYPVNDNLSGRVSLTTTEKYADGYIQADVKLEAPTDSARTYYTGNLIARCVDHQINEIGTRFGLKLNSNGTITATLELLVRDPNTNNGSYYGTVTGVAANSYTISDFDINKVYNVKLQTVGNCVTVFLDNESVIVCTLDNTYAVATRTGSFGVANLSRNSTGVAYDNVVAVSLKTHNVSATNGVETKTIRDLKTVTTMRSRNAYIAGEVVTLEVTDEALDLETLSVKTESGEPVALIEALPQQQYTFVMPKENVSVTCEKLANVPGRAEGETLDSLNFDSVANNTALSTVLDNTWVTSPSPLNANNFKVVNEAVSTQFAFTATKNQAFNSGYVQADICIAEPTTALSGASGSKTVYGGNLSLRYSNDGNYTEELRTRFKVTKSANGAYSAALELVVYNKNDSTYGNLPAVKSYPLTSFAFGKTYNVKLTAIGNYLEVSLDEAVVMQYCLNPDGELSGFEGYAAFGHTSNSFAVTFDNITIVKYDTYTVQKDSELADLLKLSQYAEPRTSKVYERNAFVAGERVTVEVLDASTLKMETLRYQTADGSETALKINASNKGSFYMPEEDVTILCSSLSNTADLPYFADFTGYPAGTTADTLFTANDGWNTVNSAKAFITENGKLEVPATVDILTSQTFHDGYIQADIQFAEPISDGTFYAGNMYANYITLAKQEIRTRFAITKNGDSSTVVLQLVGYDIDLSGGTDGSHYPQSPMIASYNVGKLDPNAVYTVKLEVIGNFVQVSLNGGVVIARTMDSEWKVSQRSGSFGFGGHVNTKNAVSATYDNVYINSYDVYGLSINDSMEGMIKLDAYPDFYNSANQHSRSSFLAGEFVILHLDVVDGKTADSSKLQYIGPSGTTAITAHNSDTMYGFTMPAERIVVTSVAVDASSGSEDGVLLYDTFDEERLMIDNGWERDVVIKNGAIQLGTDEGVLTLNLTQKRGATEWTDYSAEATITMTKAAFSDQDMVAALCARGGYEFGIYFPAGSQKGYFRLYDRTSKEFLVTSVGTAVIGESYTLRIELSGTTLTGYVNGEKVFTVKDDTCSSGAIGLRLTRAYIECDNVIVKEID